MLNQSTNLKADGDSEIDIENNEESDTDGADNSLQNILTGKQPKTMPTSTREMLTVIGKRIQHVKAQYANIMRFNKNTSCYSRYCNMTAPPGKITTTTQSLTSTCYSPICLQKARLKLDLIALLRKANALNNNQSTSNLSIGATIAQSQTNSKTDGNDEARDAIRKDLESAVASATHCTEETPATNVVKDVASPPIKKMKIESNGKDVSSEHVVTTTTNNIVTTTTVTTTQQTIKSVDGVIQSMQESTSSQNSVTFSSEVKTSAGQKTMIVNRRGRTVQRSTMAKELNADGTERVYSTTSTEGKVYLKKVAISLADRKKKRTPVKYPLCSTFCTKNKHRSILLLPQHELRKLARVGGRIQVQGFHHMAKVFH